MKSGWNVQQGPVKFDDEGGDRATSFDVPRPKIDHLAVPDLLDPEYMVEMTQKYMEAGKTFTDFVNDYCSDDEDEEEYRPISPCTFVRWAEGCKRWDAPGDKHKSTMEERKEYEIPVRCHGPLPFLLMYEVIHVNQPNRPSASGPSLPTLCCLASPSSAAGSRSTTSMMASP